MKDLYKEQLSCLLDNELKPEEMGGLITALETDVELNQQLDRYALIREVLTEDVSVPPPSFLKNIHEGLPAKETSFTPTCSNQMVVG